MTTTTNKDGREATDLPISDAWIGHNVSAISLRIARAEFESNPPELQEERRQYVRQLLAAERRRGQKSISYLARHAREIYGI